MVELSCLLHMSIILRRKVARNLKTRESGFCDVFENLNEELETRGRAGLTWSAKTGF